MYPDLPISRASNPQPSTNSVLRRNLISVTSLANTYKTWLCISMTKPATYTTDTLPWCVTLWSTPVSYKTLPYRNTLPETHYLPVQSIMASNVFLYSGHKFWGWPVSRSLPPVTLHCCTIACPRIYRGTLWLILDNVTYPLLWRLVGESNSHNRIDNPK